MDLGFVYPRMGSLFESNTASLAELRAKPDPGIDETPTTKFKGNSAVDFVDPGRSGRYTLKK